jgi:xylan 1,4-beta-xylosidase
MPFKTARLCSFLLSVLPASFCAAELHTVSVDFSSSQPDLRPLHGINKGPLAANGLIEVTDLQKQLRIPFTRLHDCQFPNPAVVDIHAIFSNPEADPTVPGNYDFRSTDEYIAAVRATGAEPIYRLGESIEHQTVKRHVHPPRDPERWAAVCAGIVRHYNEGWAGGFRYGIRYWEIWNEPENRPVMWTGTDAQFLDLYKVTAQLLRKEFPPIKIGGPGFGSCGSFDGTNLQPSAFCSAFLDQCRKEPVPFDFFSWHCYTDNPAELVARSKAVRKLLDERGFQKTENHLNEWNYLPGNSWDLVSRKAAPEGRQRGVDAMMGAAGAAFLAASLIELQDAPVDVCNLFHGETGIFGLFTEVGAPTRNYYGVQAFAQMLDTPKCLTVTGGISGKLAVIAGTNADKTKAAVLIANPGGPESIRLSITNFPGWGQGEVEVKLVDGQKLLEPLVVQEKKAGELNLSLRPPCVAILSWQKTR